MDTKELKIIGIFAFFSILLSIITFNINNQFYKFSANDLAIDNAVKKSIEREECLQDFIEKSKYTLYAIRDLEVFHKYVQNDDSKKILESIMLSYVKSQLNFMQLRYIDENGNEQIRIQRDTQKSKPYIVNRNNLQNKSDRYYFTESKQKTLERVWLSSIDLNVENNKVELPYKPTLRVMLPIEKNGNFGGILIVNYFMESFLDKLTNTPLYDIAFFDDDGYTLSHYTSLNGDYDKSWGNSLEHRYNIKNDLPEFKDKILNVDSLKNEYFYMKKFDTEISGGLNMIFKLKDVYLKKQEAQQIKKNLLITTFILLFTFIIGLIVYRIFRNTLFNLNEIKNLNETLRQQKNKLTTLIDNASDGIAVISLSTEELLIHSKTLEKILGYDNDELAQLSVCDWDKKTDSLSEYLDRFEGATNTPITFERTYTKKDGTTLYVLITAVIVTIDNEEVLYLSISDISQIKEKDKILFEQAKMASLGELIGNIAHQWRQPLSNISIRSTSLIVKDEMNMLDDKEVNNSLDKINESAQFLSKTLDTFGNLLDVKKEKSKLDVGLIIDKVYELSQITHVTHNINFIKHVSCENIYLVGVENDLMQVFVNIIENAKETLVENKVEDSYIDITCEHLNDVIKIQIKDNGGGIPEDVMPNIFEPYYTTKHKEQGKGLGLYISYKIITESFYGKLYANNDSKGAVFTIEIPLQKGSSE